MVSTDIKHIKLMGKFVLFASGKSVFGFNDLEKGVGLKRSQIVHALDVLRNLGVLTYQIIPWNSTEDNIFNKFNNGEKETNTQTEKGVAWKADNSLLRKVLKSEVKLTAAALKVGGYLSLPKFLEKESKIIFENKECVIPVGNQFAICRVVFENPLGEWVKENDILSSFDQEKDNRRSVRDAILLINRKVKKCFGIDKLIEYSNSRARIKKELFS